MLRTRLPPRKRRIIWGPSCCSNRLFSLSPLRRLRQFLLSRPLVQKRPTFRDRGRETPSLFLLFGSVFLCLVAVLLFLLLGFSPPVPREQSALISCCDLKQTLMWLISWKTLSVCNILTRRFRQKP